MAETLEQGAEEFGHIVAQRRRGVIRPPEPGFFEEDLKVERLTAGVRSQPLPDALCFLGIEPAPSLRQPALEEEYLGLVLREGVQIDEALPRPARGV